MERREGGLAKGRGAQKNRGGTTSSLRGTLTASVSAAEGGQAAKVGAVGEADRLGDPRAIWAGGSAEGDDGAVAAVCRRGVAEALGWAKCGLERATMEQAGAPIFRSLASALTRPCCR